MLISICIPTYNQAKYLIKAIRSASEQTERPCEIIVSNDCSTDNTSEVLETLSKEIPELRVINQHINLGIAANTDFCLRLSKGEFIVRLDSDDYLYPYYCEKLGKMLENFPQAGFAHAGVQEIDEHDNFLNQRWLARTTGFQSSTIALQASTTGYKVTANIIMFRKTALEKVNYLTGRPNYVEDFHLSASLAASGYGNVYLSEKLAFYRVWVDEGKTRQRRKLMEISGIKRVFDDVLEPAFNSRNWGKSSLNKNKRRIACIQADCLGWNVYTLEEKKELKEAILKLSSSRFVKIFICLYLNDFGKALGYTRSFQGFLKSRLKSILFRPSLPPTSL